MPADVNGYLRFPDARDLRGDSKYRPSEGWFDLLGYSFNGQGLSGPGGVLVASVVTNRSVQVAAATLYGTQGRVTLDTPSGVRMEVTGASLTSYSVPTTADPKDPRGLLMHLFIDYTSAKVVQSAADKAAPPAIKFRPALGPPA